MDTDFDIKMMVKSNAFEVGNQHSQLRPIPLKEGRICCVDQVENPR